MYVLRISGIFALIKLVVAKNMEWFMRILGFRKALLMALILAVMQNVSIAGIEDVIDETRESEGSAFLNPYDGYTETVIGPVKLATDLFKQRKSIELNKSEIPSGIRITIVERSSRPIVNGQLVRHEKMASSIYLGDVKYEVKGAQWSTAWADVVEDVENYPVLLSVMADNINYHTVMTANPLGFFDIDFRSVVLYLSSLKGSPVKGDVVMVFTSAGKTQSNEIKVKISKSTVSTFLTN